MLDFIKGDSMQISSSYGYTYTPTINKTAKTNQISKTEETKEAEETQGSSAATWRTNPPITGSKFYDDYMDDKAKDIYSELRQKYPGSGASPMAMELLASMRYEYRKNGTPADKMNMDDIIKIRDSGEYMKLDFRDFLKMMSDSEKLNPDNKYPFYQEFYSLYTDESYSPLDLKA